jgi:hypothetical protein
MGGSDRARQPIVHAALADKRCRPEAVLEHTGEGDEVMVGMHNTEPATVPDAMESSAERLSGVRAHQMTLLEETRRLSAIGFSLLMAES